ncbi:MAG TPA: mannose-1-phosphate guanylyltransferase/mannose-6-phosphate isomerase, partial [Rubrivivax sp.]|nr:mannose-1-phosphate guanylyltransferase/mannose-6-phosphate isomerase [Rubrivivax sp.]
MNDKPSIQVQPVVMAGGSGTRLWPLSRSGFPKQFLVLSGSSSLFQQAVQRLQQLGGARFNVAPPVIVGNEEHRFLVLDQLRELRIEPGAVLLEPIGRNTAPALTLAALQALEEAGGTDPVLVVTSADQTVTDDAAFTTALRGAVQLAADGAITILGIRPDRPETGYGYIRADGSKVAQFVEKPDLATAQKYVADGGYFWNAGMFVLKASVWMAALERFRPEIAAACRTAFGARSTDAKFVRPGKSEFAAVPADSVDYAVMEKCPGVLDIRMQELAAGWNDLGAWEAVWQVAEKDGQGNASTGDAIVSDSRNTLVHATSRLVSVVGLEDVVVVETPDAVLVASREKSQDVKNIVNQLGREQRGEQMLHRKVHRPWGWYDSIDNGPRHQVKRILVKPGASLSLQMHHHRAEHWIVVSGTAEVTNGDKVIMLTENQSTYIPLGQTHRLANPGKVPLEIIEVQSGSYLGEDDIVRFEDTYGRV